MKKALGYIFSILILCMTIVLPMETVYAADITIAVSNSSVNIGDSVTVTVTVPENISGTLDVIYPSDLLEFSKASAEVNSSKAGTVAISIGKYGLVASNKVTITFKAKTAGDATVNTKGIDFFDNNGETDSITLGDSSAKITIKNETSSDDDTLSSDYYLSKLNVTAGSKSVSLSPTFSYRKTNYTATVDYDVTNVVVSVSRSNNKAEITSITDNGNVNLKVGENVIEIVVKAENGKTLTYKVTITRKEKPADSQQPNSSENPGTSEDPGTSENPTDTPATADFEVGGVALYVPKEIPDEKIPKDFIEKTLILAGGKEVQGLSFEKAALTVLYLENENKVGSLYVYNAEENQVYPFVKILSESSYVMVLLPDDLTAPKDYSACTLSIEGKGIVSAYQYQEEGVATSSDFYLLYCMNEDGTLGWYQYDAKEGTYQRYVGIIPVDNSQTDTEGDSNTEDTEDTQAPSIVPGDDDLQNQYDAIEKELQEARQLLRLVICTAVFVVALLVIVIINLLLSKHRKEDEDDEEDDDDDDGVEFIDINK